jgi:hypothetical protein
VDLFFVIPGFLINALLRGEATTAGTIERAAPLLWCGNDYRRRRQRAARVIHITDKAVTGAIR